MVPNVKATAAIAISASIIHAARCLILEIKKEKGEIKMTMCKRCGVKTEGSFGDRKKDYITCPDCIMEIARAVGSDEANRNMRKNKREKWNR